MQWLNPWIRRALDAEASVTQLESRNLAMLNRIRHLMAERDKGKIWTKNRCGNCCHCGKALKQYDSKFIEVAEPHKIMCSYGFEKCDKIAVDEREWYYWTDG